MPPSQQATRGVTRPMARRAPPPSGLSGVQLAGILFLLSSLVRLLQYHLLARWWETSASATETYAVSAVTAVIGLGLLQGSAGARTATLWLLGLGLLAVLGAGAVGLALVPQLAPLVAWIGGPALLSILGYLILLVGEHHPGGRLALGTAMVLAGLGLSVWGLVKLTSAPDPEFAKLVGEWTTGEREFTDAGSGLGLKIPEGWVILKPGNPLADDHTAITLAHPQATGFAVVRVDRQPGIVSNDGYLEALLAARRAKVPSMKELARVDSRVGQTTARAMSTSWLDQGRRRFYGLTTAWRDVDRQFSMSIAMRTSQAAEGETEKLASVLTFDAPLSKHLDATVKAVTAAVPMLSRSAVEAMAKTMKAGTQPEAYFRQAYLWATRGASVLDAAAVSDLRAGMDALLGQVARRDRARLDAYLERVRAGQPTAAADDAAMAAVVKNAVLALSPDAQTRLRSAFEQAVEVGRLM